jgi:flagellar biosynthesis protein FlhB
MAEGEDRTEAPSARRLEQARRDGNLAISRELGMLAMLAAAGAAALASLPSAVAALARSMAGLLGNLGQVDVARGGLRPLMRSLLTHDMMPFLPLLLASALGTLAIGLLQSGLSLRPQALMPQFSRISPLSGIGRIFGGETLVEAFKALLKLGAFAAVIWSCTAAAVPEVGRLVSLDPASMLGLFGRLLFRALVEIVGLQALIAALDLGWVRWRRLSKLKMTRQEQRDEFKETEGDPHIKGRIRALRQRRARRRMLDEVPKAAVVITNPTHYAVALAYDQGGQGAPKIVAKGVDEVAARIREAARKANVPLVPNPPLARALHRLEIDTEIPHEHFQAVAAIIAFVWRQRRSGTAG